MMGKSIDQQQASLRASGISGVRAGVQAAEMKMPLRDKFHLSISSLGISEREIISYCPNAEVARIFQGLIEQRKSIFAVAFVALALTLVPGVGGLLGKSFISVYMAAINPFVTGMALARHSAGEVVWQFLLMFLSNVILSCTLFIATIVAWRKISRRPNALAIRKYDLAFVQLRFAREARIIRSIVWRDVFRVALNEELYTQWDGRDRLVIILNKGREHIRLSDIVQESDRVRLLQGLQKHLAPDQIAVEVIQALKRPPVEQSYTELWLRELAAPLERKSLTPLACGSGLQNGHYRIGKVLGTGGQATVYEAIDEHDHLEVALKEFILPVFSNSSLRKKASDQFQDEAIMLSGLRHPHIVSLRDAFVEDHRAYLVLEKINGRSLDSLVASEGAASERTAVSLGMQACEVLQYLHTQNPPIVHCDISPDNFLLDDSGRLKLIDFSVAQKQLYNMNGGMVGKRSYIAPEQFRGKPVTQSDIYSLGATLYFILSGREPEAITCSHIRNVRSNISPELDQVIAKATALRVEERYQSAQQFAEALERTTRSGTPTNC